MKKPASYKYNLTISPGVYHVHGFGEVDLRSLTMEKADYLFSKNFPYLVLLPKATKAAKAPSTKKISNKVK